MHFNHERSFVVLEFIKHWLSEPPHRTHAKQSISNLPTTTSTARNRHDGLLIEGRPIQQSRSAGLSVDERAGS